MWNDGYVSEVDYVHGYFGQLAPAWIELALLSRGIAHSIGPSPTYLELGCGQGLSLLMHAAVAPGLYYGVDFNPSQVCNARELAASAALPVEIFEQSFDDFARRDDLPEFDIIALHGVWSWVSAATRDTIIGIVKNRLRAGGVLYISYNTMPGWSSAMPLRHLMHEYGRRGTNGRLLSRVEEAISFAEAVMNAGARYFVEHPDMTGRLASIRQQDRHYVSHEYFNSNWQPMSFAEVADMLSEAKLEYAASANIIDNLDGLSIPTAALPILEGIGDETLRQLTRDYFVNQSFRRDIFVKGSRSLPRAGYRAIVQRRRFLRIGTTPPTRIETAAGTADLLADVYGPIGDLFAGGGERSLSVGELVAHPACAALTVEQIWEAMLVLVGVNFLAPAVDTTDVAAAHRLNAAIIARSAVSSTIQYLAAPHIGAGIHADRLELLFLDAATRGEGDPVAYAARTLSLLGESVVEDGVAITDPEWTRALLANKWRRFNAEKRPLLDMVGVV